MSKRQEQLEAVAEEIEWNLQIIVITAIEDKIQEGVPKTIYTLMQAGIKVWVLTGDKQETAINIAWSCKLLTKEMTLMFVNSKDTSDSRKILLENLKRYIYNINLPEKQSPGTSKQFATNKKIKLI